MGPGTISPYLRMRMFGCDTKAGWPMRTGKRERVTADFSVIKANRAQKGLHTGVLNQVACHVLLKTYKCLRKKY